MDGFVGQQAGLTREKLLDVGGQAKAKAAPLAGRLARGLFALAVLGTTAFFIHDRFFVAASDNAIMAGSTIILRSPIDGRIAMQPWSPEQTFAANSPVATIVNELVDTQRLAELRAALATIEGEIAALEQRAAGTAALLDAAILSAEAFRRIRLEQLHPRIAESEALARAAAAKLAEAEAAAARGEILRRQGFTSAAALDVLRRDLAVARDQMQAAAERRASLLAEQKGAAEGIFATDNATDRSISQQTTDRLALTLVETDAMLADRRARLQAAQRHVEAEERRLARQSQAVLVAPSATALAQLQVQSGEFVRAGQEIARLAACGERLVRAELDERTFRSLRIGQRAAFRPAGRKEHLPGEVIQLLPTSLAPGAPRVRPQAILQLGASDGACETGQIGAVRFG